MMLLRNKIMEALIPPMIWLTTFLENLNRALNAIKPHADIEAMAKSLGLDRPLLPVNDDSNKSNALLPEPYTTAWYAENATRNMQMIEASKPTALEAINGMRAAFGYEPLPEEPKPEYEGMLPTPADWKPE